MEHLLIHFLVETIQALDRRLQKPLARVVPDLSLLRIDPERYLAQNAVTLGPRRRHVLCAVLGAVLGALVTVAVLFLLKQFGPRVRRDATLVAGLFVTFAAVTVAGRTVLMRLLPGGSLTLRPEGAELCYKERILFLPWDLLQAAGTAFEPDPKLVVLPINPQVPVAVRDSDGKVEAILPDGLELPQAECSEFSQLAIKDLYEVRVGEVGELLREIGLRLCQSETRADATEFALAPLAVPVDQGWLNVQLTQLPFPPFCSGCGDATSNVLPLTVGAGTNSFSLPVPFCNRCGAARTQRRLLAALVGAAIGFGAGMLLGLNIGIRPRANPAASLILGVALGVVFAIGLALVAQLIARDALTPVRCREYKPAKGTVKLRFRWPVRAAPLLHAMGLEYREASTSSATT